MNGQKEFRLAKLDLWLCKFKVGWIINVSFYKFWSRFFDVSMGIGVGEKGKYWYGVCLLLRKWTSNLMHFYYINIAEKCTEIHVFGEIFGVKNAFYLKTKIVPKSLSYCKTDKKN